MALFQDEQITEEQFNNKYNLNKEPDTFSNLGYDDIIKERQEIRNKRIEEESQWVKNLVSPDKFQGWKNQGHMSAIQVWHKKNKNELMPYMGTWKQGTKAFNIKDISDKLQTGQVVTPDERKQFEDFVLDLAEIQTRGYTFGGQVTNIGLETIPFMAEFALGLLTTGGTSSFGATTSKLSTELMKKGLTRQIGEGIAKTAFNASINPKTYAFTATRLPQQVRARMGDIMLSDSLAITPEGQTILKESEERPAIAFMKALALTNIETASEMSGEMLVRPFLKAGGKLGKVIASPILKQLPEGFTNKFVKLAETVTKMPFLEGVRTFGFDGMLEEMGEERVGDLLKFAFNLDGEEGYSFEQLLDAMFPNISQGIGETLKQLGAEALSFGMTGMGMHAMHNTLKALPKVGDKYSKDGFLVDAGIFRIAGYDSYLDKTIKDKLVKEGKTEEEIDNVLDFSTRDDKIQYLKESKTEFDSKKEYDEKEFEKDLKRAEVEDKTYEKLIKGGVSQDVAYANAKLFGQFFRKFGSDNQKEFDEWYDKFDVQYNVPAPKGQNTAQFQNEDITKTQYFKKWFGDSKVVDENGNPLVVYHGTTQNFDEFSGGAFFTDDYMNADGYAYGENIYECYLKISNPLVIDCKGAKWDNLDTQYGSSTQEIISNLGEEYDGVIFNNINDNWIDDEEYGDVGTVYYVVDNKQIKSVNNQGTFDANNPNIYYQSAYHGTPHRFDDFSLDAIGTGEGAFAHGWGLYFTESEDVAEKYREILNSRDLKYDGKTVGLKQQYNMKNIDKYGKKVWLEELNKQLVDAQKELSLMENTAAKNNGNKIIIDAIEEQKKIIADVEEDIKISEKIDAKKISKGQLFEVDIPESKELLNEDKTISKQNKKIKEAIIAAMKEVGLERFTKISSLSVLNGGEVYNMIASSLGSNPEKASKLLLKHGIKGITYNGRQDGRCYVIFDDNAVDVLKTYYQEENPEEEKLIAGYTYIEVMDKLTEIYDKISNMNEGEPNFDKYMAYTHILEDAFEMSMNPEKYNNQDKVNDTMLNVYYIMNGQEIPEKYVESDKTSQRTYNELKELHEKRKEENEQKYRGYFYKDAEGKPIVTIMQNSDSSTALHEFGHLYLDLLNELAKVNKDAESQLEAVNKWLGYSGEYTTAQHEKFANNFVAYLYKGQAPNAKLKTVFENFKQWLKSVYEHVLDIPDVDISPEVQELFDNIFGGDEFIEEKKQANELLKKVRKISAKQVLQEVRQVDDSKLDKTQKRHKDVAYEILSVATGKSTRYLKSIFETSSEKRGLGKKRENIQELLDKVDDKITVSGGMRSHWLEFYNDTGVSYENDETDGDYILAEQAFRDIINKSWGKNNFADYENALAERAEYFANEIDKSNRQYNILLRSYKKENRNVALSAIYEWLNEMHSELKQEYEDRFIYDSGMIDREENIDKFDKAKREIIARAMELDSSNGIKTINDNEKYKEIVQQIIRSLDFLNPFDKAKLTANILDVPTTSFLMARIDSILDIAKTMEDVSLRRNLEREIHKELQGTKNVRKNGRSVGKYDYRTNKIFEELRTLDRLSPEKANEMRLESSKFATAEDNGLSFKDKLVNKFLSYKAGGRTFADTELMKSLYDEITRIKLAGKTAKSEMELMDGLTEEQDIEELINIVNAKKDASIGTKIHLESIGNLESMLNAIFGKDIKERYATEILYAETQAQTFEYEQKKKLEEGIAKIYNLPKWNWDKQIIKYLGQEYKYPEIRRKYDEQGEIVKTRMIDRTLTKMDIIQAYIWSKNEILEKRLMNQFGEDTLYSMFEELSKEDEQLAQLLMDTAQSFYPLVNKAFIEKYGLDLPKVSCYFPSTPERGSEVDLYNEYSSKSLGNGFTKARANSETQAMDFHNPVATLYSHIDGVAKFCFMSNILDKSNIRFRDKDLKRAIVNKYGDGVFKVLENMLMSITYKSEGKINNAIEKIIDGMTSNWTVANIAGKLSIAFKQFISANNYALDMPSAEWFAGFTKSILDSSNTIKYMWNIPYVRARFGGSYSSEYLKQSIGNKLFTKTTKLKDALTIFLRLGDAGSLVFGGKPYIDYLINTKGMSEEQAIKQFIIQTNRYQQSSATTSLGMLQINASKQGWARPFTTYKNQQFQYLRGAIDSLYSCMNGDISKTECAKTIFHNIFLQPFIFNLATSGSLIRLATTGDDDDLIADLRDSIFNLGTDAIAGLDIIWKAVIQKAFGEKNVRIATIPMWGDIQKEIFKLFKKDAELGDILHSAGYLFGNIATGIPINTVVSESKGIGTMLSDDVLKGLLMISGISEKTAGHMTGKEKK